MGALLMVPADGNFTTAIQKGDHKAGEIQGQTRQHARLLNLLGVKQLIIGINKKDSIAGQVPVLPISGWIGDNLLSKSDKMPWWNGVDITNNAGTKLHINCLLDALNDMACLPSRKTDSPMRVPISGIYKIKGVGDVVAGRVEQGTVEINKEVIFLPTHTAANACAGKVFSVEMHHKRVEKAVTGDNVGMNIKGLDKSNMPRVGDVMIYKSDSSLKAVKNFTAQIQTLDIPGEIKPGYSPIGFVRCGRSACKINKLNWKVGKETGKKKLEDPHSLKSNEAAEIVFEPIQPLIVDAFPNCEGLSRIAFLDGNTAVMLGKVVSVETK